MIEDSELDGTYEKKIGTATADRKLIAVPYNWYWELERMAHMVFCVRNKKEMEGLDEPPFDSEFGQKIFKNVSKAAWGEWVDRQKMLLNEYRLQPWTPSAQQFLVEQMEEFFFGSGGALPQEYVAPAH